MEDGKSDSKVDSKKYVAAVFFHGMGQQRSYESTARLVEALDEHVFTSHRIADAGYDLAHLDTRTRRELLRGSKDDEQILYIQGDYGRTPAGDKRRVRFYEAYWAPATVLGTTSLTTFLWFMRQIARPFAVLTAPWRAYSRLLRADLIAHADRKSRDLGEEKAEELRGDVRTLLDLHNRFSLRRKPEPGRFSDFLKFIAMDREKSDRKNALLKLAWTWRRVHWVNEAYYAFLLLGIGISVVAGAGLLALLVWKGLAASTGLVSFLPETLRPELVEALKPGAGSVIAFVSILLGMLGIKNFFRDYIGDVRQFVTYEEAEPLHERRQKVLCMAEKTLRHTLEDPDCERIVVIAHSLGTAVALDTILRLRAANQAANPEANGDASMDRPLPLAKIQHFFTFGSPIDKVNYFFASLRSPTRSYESLIDELRGDIGSAPFSKSGRQPHIHWINFWDNGDPISGPIETAAAAVVRDQRVDNVQIASYLVPDPGASHEGYLAHRKVVQSIFEAAFLNGHSFVEKEYDGKNRRVWRWLGPGKGSRLQGTLLLTLPVAGFLLVPTVLAQLIPGFPSLNPGWLGGLASALVAGAWLQRRFGLHLAPIHGRSRLPPKAEGAPAAEAAEIEASGKVGAGSE